MHSGDVNEYSKMLRERIDGDLLELVRKRMQESRERTALNRKRYVTHLREHRCDPPI